MFSAMVVGSRAICGSVPALRSRRLYRMAVSGRPHRTRTSGQGTMNDPVEHRLRAKSHGDDAVYRALMKSHVARMERFLDRLDPRRRAARLARAYRAPASPN